MNGVYAAGEPGRRPYGGGMPRRFLYGAASWYREITAWAASLLSIVGEHSYMAEFFLARMMPKRTLTDVLSAIVILLRSYDGKPPPELPLSLTLNGILQFIITLAQTLFSLAIVQGLSQLKWLWFSSAQPLSHFQAYDDASRGGIWSLTLLFRLTGSNWQRRWVQTETGR